MGISRILVLLSKSEHLDVERRISQQACADWRRFFHFYPMEERKDARKPGARSPSENTDKIQNLCNYEEYQQLVVQDSLLLDYARLSRKHIQVRKIKRAKSIAVLASELLDILKELRLDWISHAENQCLQSNLQNTKPRQWQEQFVKLGYDWVGEILLKRLRVISGGELRRAFHTDEAETLGYAVCHAYFKDDEAGSSSIAVRDTLEHMYRRNVVELDPHVLHDVDADVIYVYEDGLWSGVELVKRLSSIRDQNPKGLVNKRLVFRYAVTSDAGLLSARTFLKKYNMIGIQVEQGRIEHYQFLSPDAVNEIADVGIDDEEMRRRIDNNVSPLAFNDDELWEGRESEAREICCDIGKQLVMPWLEERQRLKGGSGPLGTKEIERWALGACGFASTTVFPKSCPKPSLPMLWLGGEVRLGSLRVDWEPLFKDKRRCD